PQLPVVLINADGDAQLTQEREALIAKYGLDGLTNLHFVDGKATKGRFVLDPSWYGELPRSYFYQADGSRKAKSGLVSEADLTLWLR
ncbi:MAG: TlpA family protein disulfide reductase, partial [Algicola sp.]|nr:TlpA family protein disulfide reductase [Algicola sp.]